MSAPAKRNPGLLWERALGLSLPSWSWSPRRRCRPALFKNTYYRPSLDSLEQRFVPAGILMGNEITLGISDGGAFVVPGPFNNLVGIQFGGHDLVSAGFPLSGFAVSVGGASYLNFSTSMGLPGTVTDISSSGTLAYRFVSNAIPDLLITREIAMPQDSRQILITTTFENRSVATTFHNIAAMEVHDPDPIGFSTINDVVPLSSGTFVRGADLSGLTLALATISQSAYASVFGPGMYGFTEPNPYNFLPMPVGTLPPGSGDPNGGNPEDAQIRLADHVDALAPRGSVTFSSTILVGYNPDAVQFEAESLASAGPPLGSFEPIAPSRNTPLDGININFTRPVVGLNVSDFLLSFNGSEASLANVNLVSLDGGKGQAFRLEGLFPNTSDEGTYQLELYPFRPVRDLAGRGIAPVPVRSWTMDTTAPGPVSLDPVQAGIVGVGPDFVSGLLAGRAPVVLSGQGEAGAKVSVSVDGALLGSVLVGSDGKWSKQLDLAGQADGNHTLNLSIRDAAGNSPPDRTFALAIDSVDPLAPGIVSVVHDTGRDDADGKTADPMVAISGVGEAGTNVTVYQADGSPIGSVIVDLDGLWSLNVSPSGGLADGSYEFSARAMDQARNVSSSSNAFKVVVDTAVPSAPLISGFSPDTGRLNDAITSGPGVTLSGDAEPDALVEITLLGSGVLGSVIADGAGHWAFSIPAGVLSDGPHQFEARVTDVAGNTGGVGQAFTVVLDTVAPAKPGIVGVTGDVGSDQILTTNTPELFGDAEAGSLVQVSEAGLGLVGSVQAGVDGHWKLAWPATGNTLSEGIHTFSISAMDVAGNISPVSDPFVVLVDTQTPGVPVISAIVPDTGEDLTDGLTNSPAVVLQGQAEANSLVSVLLVEKNWRVSVSTQADGSWQADFGTFGNLSDGKWTFVASAKDLAGNTSSLTSPFQIRVDRTLPNVPAFQGLLNDTGRSATDRVTSSNAPGLKGVAEPFSTVVVFKRDTFGLDTEWARVSADASGVWSLDMSASPLAQGNHLFVLKGLDKAGNYSGNSSVINIKIDRTTPSPTDRVAIVPETGMAADGTPLTNQAAPLLSGIAEANAQVEIRLDGVILPPILIGSGNWSYPLGTLSEGDHVAEARVIDLAGNTSDWTAISFGVDVTPPGDPNSLSIGPDTGPSGGDLITGVNALRVSGNADPDSEVWVLLDGLFLGSVRANVSGTWEFPFVTSIESADHLITAVAIDRAGNPSVNSAELTFTVDTAAPDSPTIDYVRPDLGLEGDGLVNTRALEIGGMSEPFAHIEVFVGGNLLGSAVADDMGYWGIALSPASQALLIEGSQALVARCTDLAGNTSPDSAEYHLSLDLTRPDKPSLVRIDKDTGRPGDLLTSDDQPVLVGLGEPRSTIQLFLGGVLIGSTKVDSAGKWQFRGRMPLDPGPSQFTFTATDAAGNESDISDPVTVTYDPTIPTDPILLGFSPNTGSALDGITSSRQVTLRGIGAAYVPLLVYVNGTMVGETLPDPLGHWTFEIPGNLADGTYSIHVCSVTAEGRESAPSDPLVIEVDATAPVLPAIEVVDPDTGVGGTDFVTTVGVVEFKGRAEAGSTVEIQINGISVGTTIADGLGNWTFQTGRALENNRFQIRARSFDIAGNDSGWSPARDLVVDSHSPVPHIALPLDHGVVGPSNWTGGIFGAVPLANFEADIRTVVVTIQDGNTGLWYDGTDFLSVVPVSLEASLQQGLGRVDWRIDLPISRLTDGHGYAVSVLAEDLAGNVSGVVTSSFQSDLSVPIVVVTPQNGGIALNLAPLVLDVQFSEPVLSFDSTNLVLPGGVDLLSISGSGTTYQVTIKLRGEAIYAIGLGGGSLKDLADNQVLPVSVTVQGDVSNGPTNAMDLVLSPTGTATYRGEINPGADEDWFTIPVNGQGLEARLSGGTSAVILDWFDALGHRLSSVRAEGGTPGILRIQPASDARFLRVSGGQSSSYTLNLKSIDPIADPQGNNFATSQLIAINNGLLGATGERTSLGDLEYLRFVAGQTGWVEAVASAGIDSSIRARLVAMDDQGNLVAVGIPSALAGESASPIRFPVIAGRTYYLRVDGLGDDLGVGGTGAWQLSGKFTPDDAVSKVETSTGSSFAFDASDKPSIRGSIDVSGDADLINVQPKVTGNYLVRVIPRITAPGLIPRILVLGENLELIRESSGIAGRPLTLSVHLDSTKVSHIQFAAMGGTRGAFDVFVIADDYGDLPGSAGTVSDVGGAYSTTGNIDLGGDVDLLRLPITQSGVLQIVLLGADGSIDQFGYAASSVGLPSGEAGFNRGKIEVVAGQDLFLRIEGIQGATGAYGLKLHYIPDDYTDKLDPLKAKPLVPGTALSGEIESFGDRDVFTWTAPTLESAMAPFRAYRLMATSNAAFPVDTSVRVYQLNGAGVPVLVASDEDSGQGTDALAFFQAQAGSTYLFVVQGASGQDLGGYGISLTEDRLTPGDDFPDSFQLARLDSRFQMNGRSPLSVSGTIDPASDTDLVRFVAPSTGSWILRVDASAGSKLDPYLALVGSNLSEISSDDNSGPGSGALIVAKLVAGEEYFFSVTGSASGGAYVLSAKPFLSGVDVSNDDFTDSKPGVLPTLGSTPITVRGGIDFVGDDDSFVLDWPSNTGFATIIARLSPRDGSGLDPFLELVDSSGQVVAQNDNDGSGVSSVLIFDAHPGQKLFLRASGYNRTLGNFSLSVEALKQPVSDDFPGAPESNAPRISLVPTNASSATVLEGKATGQIDQIGDRDFTQIVAPMDGFLTAQLLQSKGSFVNPYLRAYTTDENGATKVVAFDDNSGGGLDSRIQIPVTAGQIIYLQSSGAAGTIGSYTLEVSVRQDDIGDLPTSGANLLVQGLRTSASGVIETASDGDLFLYRPTLSGSVTAKLSGVSDSLNPYLFFYRASDGALVASNNDISATNRSSQVQLQVDSGETYWVVAKSAGGTLGEYGLEIKPVFDDYASSAVLARAVPLGADNSISLRGKIEATGDTDWVRLAPTADGILRLHASGDGAEGVDTTLAIYTDSGQILGQSDDTIVDGKIDPSSETSVAVRAGRTYLVRIAGYGESTGGWKLDITPGSSLNDDLGNTFDTADLIDIPTSGSTKFQGTLDAADQDVVRFLAPDDGDVVVRFSGTAGEIRAFTRDGTETLQVASGALVAQGGTLRFPVTKGQEVFLVAVAPENTKVAGGDFKAEISLVKSKSTTVRPVSGDVVSTLGSTLNSAFTQRIAGGQSDEDYRKIRDQITQSLVESFKAASGGKLTTSYLIIWLDPVDFVVTDAASQQIGNTATQGAIMENSAATLSQKGALDLVIIPGAQASSYSMQLFGVGGGRVLAGASMVQADGTIVNPTVSVNGTQVASGVPVGSVPKEGLTLSLDFRGEQVVSDGTTSVVIADTASEAAQQVVGTLLKSVGTGAGGMAISMAEGIEVPMTDLLTLLIAESVVTTNDAVDGSLDGMADLVTPEERQLIVLVNEFVAEIREAFSNGVRLFSLGTNVRPADMLALLKKTLDRLGFDGAQAVIDKVGQEAGELLAGVINGSVRMELVNKPLNRLWTNVLAEIKTHKANHPAAASKVLPANANQKTPQKTAMANPVSGPLIDPVQTLTMTTSTILARGTPGLLATDPDQLWLEGWTGAPMEPIAQSTAIALPPEMTESTDRLWGLVAAAMLAPSWIRSGSPANRTRSRTEDEGPIRLPENSTAF